MRVHVRMNRICGGGESVTLVLTALADGLKPMSRRGQHVPAGARSSRRLIVLRATHLGLPDPQRKPDRRQLLASGGLAL